VNAVAKRLYDKCAYAKWARAVLHDPILRCANPSTGKWFEALGEPTSVAIRSHSISLEYVVKDDDFDLIIASVIGSTYRDFVGR